MKSEYVYVIIMTISAFLLGSLATIALGDGKIIITPEGMKTEIVMRNAPEEVLSHVANTSDSMGLTLRSDYTIQLEKFRQDDWNEPWLGNIYVFSDNGMNSSVIHRYVAKIDAKCYNETMYIFKGDNNYWADEPIPKKYIEYELVGVRY